MENDERLTADLDPIGRDVISDAVSVVIPTTGRGSLTRAVQSVLDQVGVTVEVIIVMNGSGGLPDLPQDQRVRVLVLDPGVGANVARHAGIEASVYPIVALLDDDDLWLPAKLRRQLEMANSYISQNRSFVVGCRIAEPGTDVASTLRPTVMPESPIPSVAGYLFRRDTLKSRRPQLQSSTLVFPRALYSSVPFQGAIPIHQDWEWILKAEETGAEILIHPEVLALCEKGQPASITAATKWWQSVSWADRRLAKSPILQRDFLLTVALRFALNGRSLRGAITCLRRGLHPSRANWRSSTYALAQLAKALPAMLIGAFVLDRAAPGQDPSFRRPGGQFPNTGEGIRNA